MQIQICAMHTTMLQGNHDVGFKLTHTDQITQIMLNMAGSTDVLQQAVAAELIVETTSKHERAKSIVASGLPVLKKLFTSKDDGIKVSSWRSLRGEHHLLGARARRSVQVRGVGRR